VAGFCTGGILAIRSGAQLAWRNAVAGAIILAIIEGVNIFYTHTMVRQQMLMMQQMGKIQEEQMKRRMRGLPELSPEEI
jgi:hypothetical protein